jgi:hypothetical protein
VILVECQPTYIAGTGFRKRSFLNACGFTSFSAVSLREVELMMAYRGVHAVGQTDFIAGLFGLAA